MNYPVWYLPETGGGVLIALIAVLHVFVSHFAVGAGLYLIYAEKKGLRENSPAILEFVKKHARFFLLLTMVFGSITGVGIWFIIALVSPAATSLLIHNFVFGWAAEWVFFIVEIVAAFVYFYTFGRMDSATHIKVGWVYFIAAWMSLFLINGIIGVMLTPGLWAENMDFWVGFFNPSFFPSLFFRTFIAVMIAACYGYFSASFVQDMEVRKAMTRFSAKWALVSLFLMLPCAIWYISVLPEAVHTLVMGKSPTISVLMPWGLVGIIGVLIIMLGGGVYRPRFNTKPVAVLSLFCALAVMGSFEWIREAARRPYVINEVMYSNGVLKSDAEKLNSEGYLSNALWVENKEVSNDNMMQAGEELFIHQCYACHTVNGINNDIVAASKNMSFRALTKYIDTIHERRYFMPPFFGTDTEKKALATYIAGGLLGKEIKEPPKQMDALAMGEVVFEEHCASCHAPDDLAPAFDGMPVEDILAMLPALNEISDEMEPFLGTAQEGEALSRYLDALNNPLISQPTQEETIGGDLLFEDHCSSCHELDEMVGIVEGQGKAELVRMLGKLDEISDEMEPFSGTAEEQEVLAEFLESAKKGGQ